MLSGCGLGKKEVVENNKNLKIILEKTKPITKELNQNLKIKLNKLTKGEVFFANNTNNAGNINFNTNFDITINYKFKTISEDEFLDYLEDIFKYDKEELLKDNKKRRYLEDFMAISSMKAYTGYLTKLHRYKDFSYLTEQLTLF